MVKLRVPGAGYAGLAIVAASWSEADVAQLVGAPVEAWRELTAAEVLATSLVVGRADTR